MILEDLGEKLTRGLFCLSVALIDKVDQHRHEVLMDLWHVEQMDDLSEVLDQPDVLSPKASVASKVVDEDHESLKKI